MEVTTTLKYLFIDLPQMGIHWIFLGDIWRVSLKVLFLLLPFIYLTAATFISTLSVGSFIVRSRRSEFLVKLIVSWWDGLRSIFNYWAGIFKTSFIIIGSLYSALRLILIGLVQTLRDILFVPLTVTKNMARTYMAPGVPWAALLITLFWIALESLIFSIILTPLIGDILMGMTNLQIPYHFVSIGLYLFLFMVIGGSLACMHALVEAIDSKNKGTIIKMVLIEGIVMMVEVVFFYREFVEAILPFFNRLTEGTLVIGPVTILAIGAMAWLAVRSATWFFFAKYGTPILLLFISRESPIDISPIKGNGKNVMNPNKVFNHDMEKEMVWFKKEGDKILDAVVLPPTQIVASLVNMILIFLCGQNVFNLPLKSMNELKDTDTLTKQIINHMKSV